MRKDARAPAPRAPFGLPGFSVDGEAVVVAVDLPATWPSTGWGDLATLLAQIPAASSLPAGTLVVVLGVGARDAGLLARAFGRGKAPIARALRASALLAHGYAHLGADVDPATGVDLAFGYCPTF